MANEASIELVLKARAATQAAFAEVDKQLTSLTGATKTATAAGEGWSGMLSKASGLLGALGIGMSVSALVSFAKGLVDSAGALVDLSTKTGASIEQLQRWAFVGQQAGVSTEQLADASFKLGVKLAGGTGSVRDAVEQLGLSYTKLRAQSPDDQFNATIAALEAMIDPQERNRLGIELFGKSFATIAPAIAQGYTDMAASAQVSSKEQIKAIDDAADAFDRFVARQKSGLTSWLGNMVIAHEQRAKLNKEQEQEYVAILKNGGDAEAFLLRLSRTQRDIVLPSTKEVLVATTDYRLELVKAQTQVDRMTDAEIAGVEAAQRLGASTDEITLAFGISEGALKVLTERTKEHEAATKQLAEAKEKAAKIEAANLLKTTKLWNDYDALRVAGSGTTTDKQIADVHRWAKNEEAEFIKANTAANGYFDETSAAATAFYAGLEATTKAKLGAIGSNWAELAGKSKEALRQMADQARADFERMITSGLHFSRAVLDEQRDLVRSLEGEVRGMGHSWQELYRKAQEEAEKLRIETERLAAIERERVLLSRQLGGAFAVSSQNFEMTLQGIATSGGWNPSGMGSNIDMNRAYGYARQGYSFQEIMDIFARERTGGTGRIPPPEGPRIPGFAGGIENFSGGMARVHEGELLVNLPRGTDVIPAGRGGTTIVNHFTTHVHVGNVLASKQELARYLQEAIVDLARSQGKRFGETN